jgi:adenylate cyclase, class 2
MREFEAHFLNINTDEIEKRLGILGAEHLGYFDLKETIFYPDDISKNQFMRVRTKNGIHSELTYKEDFKAEGIGNRIEVETEIFDPDNMKLIIKKLGWHLVREQEKRRATYKLDGVVYDIDWWPKVPPYIEIESDDEDKVRKASEQLGFKWEDACFLDAKKILIERYGLKDFDNIKYFTFDKYK